MKDRTLVNLLLMVAIISALLVAGCTQPKPVTLPATPVATPVPTLATPVPTTAATTGTTTVMTTASAPATTTMPATPTTVPSTPPPGVQAVTFYLTEKGNRFIPASLTATAGATITLVIDDQDPNPHNFALYSSTSYSAPIFKSPVVTGPVTLTYTFPAPASPGAYYFRSDPDVGMAGTLYLNSRILYGY